jgi:hypothetical protein
MMKLDLMARDTGDIGSDYYYFCVCVSLIIILLFLECLYDLRGFTCNWFLYEFIGIDSLSDGFGCS